MRENFLPLIPARALFTRDRQPRPLEWMVRQLQGAAGSSRPDPWNSLPCVRLPVHWVVVNSGAKGTAGYPARWLCVQLPSATIAHNSMEPKPTSPIFMLKFLIIWSAAISDYRGYRILWLSVCDTFVLHVSSVSNTMLWARANLRPHLQYSCILDQV